MYTKKYFNKKLARDLLIWITKSQLPNDFNEEETKIISVPLTNILKNEFGEQCIIHENTISIKGKSYRIVPAFKKCVFDSITDFEIVLALPVLLGKLFA